eukprot:CAMPEP_0172460180 /NCGR_PEP_ID=MMETSP1065-20121228/35836_1 /TAXON_ID=265537 /ORGANISM="Amphiprora paludosa, Strain CCMP125" /LENGTH=325 /DNA_ID=CAMNT_0013215133 /DNA_START=39 /DNA_END=1016 /DNA_ORIENTATION=-
MTLSSRYFARLKVDPNQLDPRPTVQKLKRIHEAHLEHIPFENLAQHGTDNGNLPSLDLTATADKLLTRQRGGFCFEVNLLLAAFLEELGYQVARVPTRVYSDDLHDFRPQATHVILLVTCHGDEPNESDHTTNLAKSSSIQFSDVGFGEPPLHPLDYNLLGKEQVTPDGMQSKIVRDSEDENSMLLLLWYKNHAWSKRLKWHVNFPLGGYPITHFTDSLHQVLQPESIFSQKIVATRLTRDQKITLAGHTLKISGPPRFPTRTTTNSEQGSQSSSVVPVSVQQLAPEEGVIRQVLLDKFGMPLNSTKGLSLAKSFRAKEEVWSHQ